MFVDLFHKIQLQNYNQHYHHLIYMVSELRVKFELLKSKVDCDRQKLSLTGSDL